MISAERRNRKKRLCGCILRLPVCRTSDVERREARIVSGVPRKVADSRPIAIAARPYDGSRGQTPHAVPLLTETVGRATLVER